MIIIIIIIIIIKIIILLKLSQTVKKTYFLKLFDT